MNDNTPLVSVMMAVYDDGRESTRHYFSEALKSILDQSFADIEVVVVLSGEQGFVEHLTTDPRVRVFYSGNEGGYDQGLKRKVRGLAVARNMGVHKSQGKYLAVQDADDLSKPNRIGAQVEYMEAHPEVGVLGSCMDMIDGEGIKSGYRSTYEDDAQIRRGLLQFNPLPQPSIMLRRQLVLDVGGYSETEIAEDYDLWVRLAAVTQLHNLQEPLVEYRVHAGGGATRVSRALYFGSLRIKWRAMRTLKIWPGPKEIAVNLLQFLSYLLPVSFRRNALEPLRGKLIIRKRTTGQG